MVYKAIEPIQQAYRKSDAAKPLDTIKDLARDAKQAYAAKVSPVVAKAKSAYNAIAAKVAGASSATKAVAYSAILLVPAVGTAQAGVTPGDVSDSYHTSLERTIALGAGGNGGSGNSGSPGNGERGASYQLIIPSYAMGSGDGASGPGDGGSTNPDHGGKEGPTTPQPRPEEREADLGRLIIAFGEGGGAGSGGLETKGP